MIPKIPSSTLSYVCRTAVSSIPLTSRSNPCSPVWCFGTIRSGSRLEGPSTGSPILKISTCRKLKFICLAWENHTWFLQRFCPRLLLASSTCRVTQVLEKRICPYSFISARWSWSSAAISTMRTLVSSSLYSLLLLKSAAIPWFKAFLEVMQGNLLTISNIARFKEYDNLQKSGNLVPEFW